MTPYTSYIISLDSETSHPQSRVNHRISRERLVETIRSCEQYAWPYEVWPAVNGYTVTEDTWRELGVELLQDRGKLRLRPGAQGCWLSHFTLWQHCVDIGQPIIVLEHDALVRDPWPDLDPREGVIKLHRPLKLKQNSLTGLWGTGAWAYLISPEDSLRLIEGSRRLGAQALDKMIGSELVRWRNLDWDLVEHNPDRRASTTSAINWVVNNP